MQQVFTIMNTLLLENKNTCKRKLLLRTYKVIKSSLFSIIWVFLSILFEQSENIQTVFAIPDSATFSTQWSARILYKHDILGRVFGL